jgi:cell division protein ZapE
VTQTSAYDLALAEGRLKPDAAQREVWHHLEALRSQLETSQKTMWQRFTRTKMVAPRGLYIHGEVGRGKTMLMDLFFASVHSTPKSRVHFHAFMQDIHRQRAALKGGDVINHIADNIAKHARLLCLDEMQVTDIADAMIIGRLFEALKMYGVCFVTTANLPPEELYKDGLNRQLFLPFITKLRDSLDVVSLDSSHDYRLGRVKSHETFIVPPSPAKLDAIWNTLTDKVAGSPVELDMLGRKLHVPHAAHGCARFSFAELCEYPLGPADFLAIAKNFRTVFVENIPVLKPEQRNEAKRFVLMIDTFYDAGTRLVATAEAEPEKLYPKGKHGFEFQRTVSRLKEMQSAGWWGKSIPET